MRTNRWLILVLIAAIVLRAGMLIHEAGRPPFGDAITYDNIATNLASGHGYSFGFSAEDRHATATRGPSYVLFLAGFYKLFGHQLWPPLAAQVLMDVGSCWIVARLASRWFRDATAGVVAAALYAVYPQFVWLTSQAITETFTTFTLLLCVLWFFDHLERGTLKSLLLSGLALGLCSLNKPQLAPFAAVLAFAALPRLGWRGASRATIVPVLVVVAAIVPWTIRNARVFHAFVPGVTMGGVSFWGGTAPFAGRLLGGLNNEYVPKSFQQKIADMGEVAANRFLFEDGLRVIAEDPAKYARITARKPFMLWFNLGFDDPASRASWALAVAHAGAFVLAFFGTRRRPDAVAVRLLWAGALFWTVLYVPFCTVVRYAAPFLPIVFIFTAGGLQSVLRVPRFAQAVAAR